MATYHLRQWPSGVGGRLSAAFVFAAAWLLADSGAERLVEGRWGHGEALAVGAVAFFLVGLFTDFPLKLFRESYVEVDEGGIRSFLMGRPLRSVRSHCVRYVREERGILGTTLVISEHSSFARRFFNSVVLRRWLLTQEQYDQIKAQALSWLEDSRRYTGS